ncbi:MAG: SPOR domain-containing protein [Pseudomonadota bacterium]
MAVHSSESDLFADHGPRGGVARALATAFWAAASLGVFVGALVWAYGLGVRNPADVPALRAAADGYKRAPAEAGGLTLPDQNRRIYSEVSGARPAELGAATPTSAPERPTAEDIDLASRDVGSDAFVALVSDAMRNQDVAERRQVLELDYFEVRPGATGGLSSEPPAYPPNVGRGSEALPRNAAGADPSAAVEIVPAPKDSLAALAAATPVGAGADADAPPSNDAPAAAETPTALEVEQGSGASFATPPASAPPASVEESASTAPAAPAPRAPETGAETSEAAAQASAPQSAANRTVAPASDGRIYQVQLAALESVDEVRKRWAQIQRSQGDLVAGMSLDVQPVSVGGAELYRLRLDGVGERTDAAQLCSELRKRGQDCFVAVKR